MNTAPARTSFLTALSSLTTRRTNSAAASNRLATQAPDTLLLQWWAFMGLLLFVTVLLGRHNVWGILKDADPTGITMTILVVFTGATLWCGRRSHVLAEERRALDTWIDGHRRGIPQSAAQLSSSSAALSPSQHHQHATDYLRAVTRKRATNQLENGQLTEVLAERLHGGNAVGDPSAACVPSPGRRGAGVFDCG